MVSGQEDDGDVDKGCPTRKGKGWICSLVRAFVVTVRLYHQSVRDGVVRHDESPEEYV